MSSLLKKIGVGIVISGLAAGAMAAKTKELTVGLAVANLQADFFNQIKQSVEEEAARQGIKVVTVDARGDSATQVNQIQDLITRQVSALIYIPAGATAATVPVKAAHKAGIPVVAVDRNPEGAPGDTFISTDSVAAARELGEYVAKMTDGKAKIGVIRGQIGTTPEIARGQGFEEAIGNYPGLKVVESQASKMWMQDEGFSIAQDMIQRNPEIDVFFGQADALAMGAAQASKVANIDPLVVGFDGDEAALKAVKKGTLDATMTQRTQYMGRLALRSAVDLADHRFVPPMQLQEATLTTKDNVDELIKAHP